MRVVILGGAFNPPHLGHQLIAEQILDFNQAEEVWLTPCYRHTFDKELIAYKHRVAMVKMIIDGKIKYCGLEIDNQLSGETIELMEFLRKEYPQHQFSFVIGSDNLENFKKWGQWERLLETTKFLVFPRPEFDYDLKKYDLDQPEYQLDLIRHPLLVTISLSSSNIRERIKKGLSISGLVPKKVEEYIKKHRLYV